jgi:hypothetical protein
MHDKTALLLFTMVFLPACSSEGKPPSGSTSAATTSAATTSAATTSAVATVSASSSAPAGPGAAAGGPAPASPGPSKITVGACTFEFDSPGLPTHDPSPSLGLDQWINSKTHVVLGLIIETKHAAGEPRSVADLEKRYSEKWDAPRAKGSVNGVSFAVFRTGASDDNEAVRAVGAAEAGTAAVACTFNVSGPPEQEAAITALAKSMRITVAAKGK